jgi:hypothetical protein
VPQCAIGTVSPSGGTVPGTFPPPPDGSQRALWATAAVGEKCLAPYRRSPRWEEDMSGSVPAAYLSAIVLEIRGRVLSDPLGKDRNTKGAASSLHRPPSWPSSPSGTPAGRLAVALFAHPLVPSSSGTSSVRFGPSTDSRRHSPERGRRESASLIRHLAASTGARRRAPRRDRRRGSPPRVPRVRSQPGEELPPSPATGNSRLLALAKRGSCHEHRRRRRDRRWILALRRALALLVVQESRTGQRHGRKMFASGRSTVRGRSPRDQYGELERASGPADAPQERRREGARELRARPVEDFFRAQALPAPQRERYGSSAP